MNPQILVALLSMLIGVGEGVSISRLTVPAVVETNTSAVVLDCEYRYNGDWEVSGLVVKWYIDGVHLVYQWIPPRQPQALGVLSGRVDTTFEASQDPWQKYRAIYIPQPEPSLSGQYTCTVSTFEDEDTRSADLLVWAPASFVDLRYWRPSEYLVNITCFASGASPRPSYSIYTLEPNGTRREVAVRGVSARRENGLWWASAWGLIVWAETEPDTIVGCKLELPGTPHSETRKKIYHPDLPIITTTTTTTTTEVTTTRASEPPRRWSNMSQHVPTTTNSFFDFPSLFGTANGGPRLAPSLASSSLACVAWVVWRVVAWRP